MRFVGVDPGITGGLALLNHDATRVKTWPMPVASVVTGGRPRQQIDLHGLFKLAEDILMSFDDDCLVTIEQVSSSPQMGVSSAFSFGMSYASVCACFAFFAMTHDKLVKVENAIPAVWKRHMHVSAPGVPQAELKKISRSAATKLWPRAYNEFRLAKDDGRAESALLAEYGRLVWIAKQGRVM